MASVPIPNMARFRTVQPQEPKGWIRPAEDDDTDDPDLSPGRGLGQDIVFWEIFSRKADLEDRERLSAWNESLNILLLFAGLLSAIQTAFIISVMENDLRPDPMDTTNAILMRLLSHFDEDAPSHLVLPAPMLPNATRVGTTWLLSLALSMLSAFGGLLGKSWLIEYGNGLQRAGHVRDRCRLRQQRFMGLVTWRLDVAIDSLSTLIEASLFIFFVGLGDCLWSLNRVVGLVVIIVFSIGISAKIGTTLIGLFIPNSPFQTRFTLVIQEPFRRVLRKLYRWTPAVTFLLLALTQLVTFILYPFIRLVVWNSYLVGYLKLKIQLFTGGGGTEAATNGFSAKTPAGHKRSSRTTSVVDVEMGRVVDDRFTYPSEESLKTKETRLQEIDELKLHVIDASAVHWLLQNSQSDPMSLIAAARAVLSFSPTTASEVFGNAESIDLLVIRFETAVTGLLSPTDPVALSGDQVAQATAFGRALHHILWASPPCDDPRFHPYPSVAWLMEMCETLQDRLNACLDLACVVRALRTSMMSPGTDILRRSKRDQNAIHSLGHLTQWHKMQHISSWARALVFDALVRVEPRLVFKGFLILEWPTLLEEFPRRTIASIALAMVVVQEGWTEETRSQSFLLDKGLLVYELCARALKTYFVDLRSTEHVGHDRLFCSLISFIGKLEVEPKYKGPEYDDTRRLVFETIFRILKSTATSGGTALDHTPLQAVFYYSGHSESYMMRRAMLTVIKEEEESRTGLLAFALRTLSTEQSSHYQGQWLLLITFATQVVEEYYIKTEQTGPLYRPVLEKHHGYPSTIVSSLRRFDAPEMQSAAINFLYAIIPFFGDVDSPVHEQFHSAGLGEALTALIKISTRGEVLKQETRMWLCVRQLALNEMWVVKMIECGLLDVIKDQLCGYDELAKIKQVRGARFGSMVGGFKDRAMLLSQIGHVLYSNPALAELYTGRLVDTKLLTAMEVSVKHTLVDSIELHEQIKSWELVELCLPLLASVEDDSKVMRFPMRKDVFLSIQRGCPGIVVDLKAAEAYGEGVKLKLIELRGRAL